MTSISTTFTGVTVTGVTAANPGVVSTGGHTLSTGDVVLHEAMDEMTELNSQLFEIEVSGNDWWLKTAFGGTARLDLSAFTAETTGGTASLGLSTALVVPVAGDDITVTFTGTWVATIALEKEIGFHSNAWVEVERWTANTFRTYQSKAANQRWRLRLITWTSGTITGVLADVDKIEEEFLHDDGTAYLQITQAGATFQEDFAVLGDTTLTGNLTVAGTQTFTGALAVTGAITSGAAITDGAASSFTTGTTIGTVTIADGSITDSSGALDFGNETLTTTGVVTSAGLETTANLGTSAATSVVEHGDARNHVTVLTATALAMADTVTTAASKAVGDLIYTFPAGHILVEAVFLEVIINPAGAENDAVVGDVGIGTTIATGAVAILSGTAGFEDFITGQDNTLDSATSLETAKQSTGGGPMYIASGDDHTLHVNVAAAWQNAASASIDYTGTVVIIWKFLGA